MSTPRVARRLFVSLVDDAAMFPPGNATAAAAIFEHLSNLTRWYGDLVGPLLVSSTRWDEFARAHQTAGSPEIRVVVVGSTARPDPMPRSVLLVGYEAPVTDLPLTLPDDGLPLAAEIPPAAVMSDGAGPARRDSILDCVAEFRAAGGDVIAKVRTGGESAGSCPSDAALAGALLAAARRGVPLKFTAGLHHGVRAIDPATGFGQHGFLNLMAATQLALDGAAESELVSLLANREQSELVRILRAWTPAAVASVRGGFVSFGCCGVGDPIGDLVSLGLLEEPV